MTKYFVTNFKENLHSNYVVSNYRNVQHFAKQPLGSHLRLAKFKGLAGWRIKQQIYSKLYIRVKNQDMITHFSVI